MDTLSLPRDTRAKPRCPDSRPARPCRTWISLEAAEAKVALLSLAARGGLTKRSSPSGGRETGHQQPCIHPGHIGGSFQLPDGSLSAFFLPEGSRPRGEVWLSRRPTLPSRKPSHTHRRFLLLPKQTLLHQKEKKKTKNKKLHLCTVRYKDISLTPVHIFPQLKIRA